VARQLLSHQATTPVPTSTNLHSLLNRLTKTATISPGDFDLVKKLLIELMALLTKFSAETQSVGGLKKPGAWRDKPLPPNTPETPYYVTVPNTIEIVNITPVTLREDLHKHLVTQDPYGNAIITIPAPHHR
jgi:hypothetical protein